MRATWQQLERPAPYLGISSRKKNARRLLRFSATSAFRVQNEGRGPRLLSHRRASFHSNAYTKCFRCLTGSARRKGLISALPAGGNRGKRKVRALKQTPRRLMFIYRAGSGKKGRRVGGERVLREAAGPRGRSLPMNRSEWRTPPAGRKSRRRRTPDVLPESIGVIRDAPPLAL